MVRWILSISKSDICGIPVVRWIFEISKSDISGFYVAPPPTTRSCSTPVVTINVVVAAVALVAIPVPALVLVFSCFWEALNGV